jgi:UDP-glucose 4-epimerase
MKKVLVTGGAGFIGSHLVDKLIAIGHRVVVIDNLSTGKRKNLNPKAKFYKLNIRSPKIASIFKKEKPDVLFHFAAQANVRVSVQNPIFDAEENILGSLNVIQSFIDTARPQSSSSSKKIVFSSTGGAIYGEAEQIPTPETYPAEPESPYGMAKLAIEKYLAFFHKTYSVPFVALRFANVYGPRQNAKGEAGVVAIFCDKLLNNQPVTVFGDGEQTRDFVYISDVVAAAILAMKSPKTGIFNVGTGKETSVNEIFAVIKRLTGLKAKKKHLKAIPGELRRSALNFSKIKRELGWRPKTPLGEGLKKTVEFY